MVIPLPLFVTVVKHALFRGMEPQAVTAVVAHAHNFLFRPHSHLLEPNDKPGYMFILLQGWVTLYRLTESGKEVTIGLHGPSDLVFEDMLYHDASPSSTGATSKTFTQAVGIPMNVMRHGIQQNPRLGANLMALMGRNMQNMGYLVEQLAANPAGVRVEKMLLRIMLAIHKQPVRFFSLPITKGEIAQFLGLSRETFSRCLHELGSGGIHVHQNQVSMDSLQNLCKACDLHVAGMCTRFNDTNFCRHQKERQVRIVNSRMSS